jgi:hypothetical protein
MCVKDGMMAPAPMRASRITQLAPTRAPSAIYTSPSKMQLTSSSQSLSQASVPRASSRAGLQSQQSSLQFGQRQSS